jgi:hypothetical protein
MIKCRIIFFFLFSLFFNSTFSQNKDFFIKGKVIDADGISTLPYVNVYIEGQSEFGTTTNEGGFFEIRLPSKTLDRSVNLIFSFIGYETKVIILNKQNINRFLLVKLDSSTETLDEVVITPISGESTKEFAVSKLKKKDIYSIPGASADPLLAVSILPYSTSIDEIANPSLRGSNPEQSVVLMNNVPIYNPVRNNQLNGLGNFSIFNLQLINQEQIYPTNPPINYGNSSGGVVEISTVQEVENTANLSLSLASLGGFISKKINNQSFIQAYSNYQFPKAFLSVNKASFNTLNDFSSLDLGVNYNFKINEKSYINTYNYIITENVNIDIDILNQKLESDSSKQRFFNVSNYFKKVSNNVNFTFNLGLDFSKSNTKMGVYNIDSNENSHYLSSDLDLKISNVVTSKIGLNYSRLNYSYSGYIPKYFFSIEKGAPIENINTNIELPILESYLFTKIKLKPLYLSFGVRKNLPLNIKVLGEKINKDYLSYQFNSRYNLKNNSFIFSFGQYNSFSIPSLLNQNLKFYSSNQFALDYSLKKNSYKISSSIYFKKDKVEDLGRNDFLNINGFEPLKKDIFGIEFFYEQSINSELKTIFSYGLVNVDNNQNDIKYKGNNDYNYSFKLGGIYNFNGYTFSLLSNLRQGSPYTSIVSSFFNNEADAYQPVFSSDFNSERFIDYFTINFSANKYIPLKKGKSIVLFASMNNVLNNKNERNFIYNTDFSEVESDYFQMRNIYFGFIYLF